MPSSPLHAEPCNASVATDGVRHGRNVCEVMYSGAARSARPSAPGSPQGMEQLSRPAQWPAPPIGAAKQRALEPLRCDPCVCHPRVGVAICGKLTWLALGEDRAVFFCTAELLAARWGCIKPGYAVDVQLRSRSAQKPSCCGSRASSNQRCQQPALNAAMHEDVSLGWKKASSKYPPTAPRCQVVMQSLRVALVYHY